MGHLVGRPRVTRMIAYHIEEWKYDGRLGGKNGKSLLQSLLQLPKLNHFE